MMTVLVTGTPTKRVHHTHRQGTTSRNLGKGKVLDERKVGSMDRKYPEVVSSEI